MSNLTPMSAFVRKIYDETDGKITYGRARSKMREAGIVPAPKWVQTYDDITALEMVLQEFKPESGSKQDYEAMCAKITAFLGWDAERFQRTMRDHKKRQAYIEQRNMFDQAKHYWAKNRPQTVSDKPEKSRNAKSRVAKRVSRLVEISQPIQVKSPLEILEIIQKQGGFSQVEKEIVALKKLIQDLDVKKNLILQNIQKEIDSKQSQLVQLETIAQGFKTIQEQVKKAA